MFNSQIRLVKNADSSTTTAALSLLILLYIIISIVTAHSNSSKIDILYTPHNLRLIINFLNNIIILQACVEHLWKKSQTLAASFLA